MFNEVRFREILLPSSGNANYYVAQKKICGMGGNNRIYGP